MSARIDVVAAVPAPWSGSSFFVIPGEVTTALQGVSRAFAETMPRSPATRDSSASELDKRATDDGARAASAAADAVASAAETEHPGPGQPTPAPPQPAPEPARS